MLCSLRSQLRLARAIVADARLPWERAQRPRRLTPTRVLRGFATLLAVVGTPAKPPKPCGRSPGRPKESRSEPAKRHPALKTAARASPRGPDPITYSFSQFSDDRPCVKDKLSRLLCFLTNEVQRRVVADAVLLGPLGPTLLVAVTL